MPGDRAGGGDRGRLRETALATLTADRDAGDTYFEFADVEVHDEQLAC
jgi:hypothetical protein